MEPYFRDAFGNPHSIDHSIGWQASQTVEAATNSIAKFIGADADEIIFTSGATEANNLALLGLGLRTQGRERRRVLVSEIEHKCVLSAAEFLSQRFGFGVEHVPVDRIGLVNHNALQDKLDDDVLAVSIMAVNNEIGTIQDIAELSKTIKKSGAIFHCDAAQAPCAVDLRNVAEIVDLLSLSSHKMYGPQGIGVLFIRRELQDHVEPIHHGGGQQQNLRSGTVPVALCVGMAAAAATFDSETSERERCVLSSLRDEFVKQLRRLPWPIHINGPEMRMRHPGNANIRFEGFDARDILGSLQPMLAASTGSACTSGIPEPSHVLRAIGLSGEQADSSIRFSIGRGTTESDIEEAVEIIQQALSELDIFAND